ncbi:MAG: hypothetical protein HKN91_15355 [Acidimicrobiia bacterium]|nr:hypothetical protein [Acidimicrobiia bacterium]
MEDHSSDDAIVNGAPVGGDEDVQEDLEWPVGFMIVVGLAALYLIWRLIQMVGAIF